MQHAVEKLQGAVARFGENLWPEAAVLQRAEKHQRCGIRTRR
jgi:hypothetical protein